MSEQKVTLKEAIKVLSEAVKVTTMYFDGIDPNDIPNLCKSFKKLSDEAGDIEDLYKILKEIKDKLSHETIPTAMENLGFDSVKLGGYNYIVGARLYASIPAEMHTEGHQWLRDHNLGAIILPTVNSKTLSAAIKSYIEEHNEAPPGTAIKTYDQKYIQVRKS